MSEQSTAAPSPEPSGSAPSRLARRLGTTDAVVIGLGAMIGAGVFAAIGPAVRAAGVASLLGLLLAGFVAYCNATSSADLAASYPESGGAYAYGRHRLGELWGFLAGWAFIVGKLASCAAMALTFGSHVAPESARPLAVTAIAALTVVNLRGIQKTALVTRAIVAFVLGSLALVVVSALLGGSADPGRLHESGGASFYGVLQAAAYFFFAFAGYARIATLGEEVKDPARTIPRAIPLALWLTLIVYGAVALSALATVDVPVLADSAAPLVTVIESGSFAAWSPAVRAGAAVASLGVLLSLIVGVSRTAFAMAANGDLPSPLAAVHPRFRVPHRAEIAVGLLVALAVCAVDLRSAIGFSSFTVLLYYAIANAAAYRLPRAASRWPRWLRVAGFIGSSPLAFSLPPAATLTGIAVLAVGVAAYGLRRRRRT